MLAGNWKSYQDFVSRTDYLEREYNEPDKSDLWEDWLRKWEEEHGKSDEENDKLLYEFFDKIVYRAYDLESTFYVDWSLQEIKDKLLEWYIENYGKLINQFGNLIRDVQRKSQESEIMKQSRFIYTKQTGSCI